ncbi:ankyrin, partial [Morchella conica CCBAS932]
GFNPLLSACHKGHEEIVWLLLTEYGYTNIRTMGSNETALILASDGGYSGIVQMLMACNADIDEVDWNDRTPLSVATTRGHIDIIRLLLDAGA